ncbi:MAG: D-alanyl-D-alanine carboxypeptidase family protein [Rhodobacterales bacterium]
MTFTWLALCVPLSAWAAPYAAFVMDARTGEQILADNADTPLHPASLTKMMTLYIAFQAVEHGEISMDTDVTISRHAAAEPPSKLGLRAGQKIKLRYLVRAAAVKSANDAATAIGEAISGSEEAFAARMNRTAKQLGMTRTTFKNANGLTRSGHLSTARDMSVLGRHVIYDYPEYYNLFSRETADAGIKQVRHTNRRMLESYPGADGIKTGYTNAAGFNLVSSAQRGSERVIATVFGGASTASRNAKVAELMDLGFKRMPSQVAFRAPGQPPYMGRGNVDVLVARNSEPTPGTRGKAIRVASAAVTQSLRPMARGGATPALLVAEVRTDIDTILESVQAAEVKAVAAPTAPVAAPEPVQVANEVAPAESTKPVRRPPEVVLASAAPVQARAPAEAEVVERLSTSGGRHWGINVGRYPSKYAAEKVLLQTALSETSSLDGSLRKVVNRNSGFDANFMGLSRDMADLACRRLQARQVTCFMIGPS